jgi:hypothetical protein
MDVSTRVGTLTFGVEIEAAGPTQPVELLAQALGGTIVATPEAPVIVSPFGAWTVVHDGSIEVTPAHPCGREFVSPIFSYNTTDLAKVGAVVTALGATGFTTSDANCGLHVHVGVQGRARDPVFLLAAVALSYEWSRVVHLVLADKRLDSQFCTLPTAWVTSLFAGFYAGRTPPTYMRVMGRILREDPRKVGPLTDKCELPRNFGVNLTSLIRHGTIEYRFFAGTLDPTLVAAYIELCARFTALALDCEPVLRPPRPPNEASMEALLDLLEVSAATRAVLLTDDVRAHARSVMTPRPLGVPALDLSLLDSESQCLARQALRACG